MFIVYMLPICFLRADLQVAKPVLQVFLLLSRFKYPTLWYDEDSNEIIFKSFASAETLYKK